MDKEKIKIGIKELIRKGYSVIESSDGGYLIEKDSFWGVFSYYTNSGTEHSHMKWGRTILLMLIYGLGLLGILYWYAIKKSNLRKDVVIILPPTN